MHCPSTFFRGSRWWAGDGARSWIPGGRRRQVSVLTLPLTLTLILILSLTLTGSRRSTAVSREMSTTASDVEDGMHHDC